MSRALAVAWVIWLIALAVIITGAILAVWWVIGLGFITMLVGAVPYGVHDSHREHVAEPEPVKTPSQKYRRRSNAPKFK